MAEYALLVSFFKGFSISAHGVKIGIIVPCDASAGLEEHFGIGNIPPLLQHPHLPFPRVDLRVAAVPFDRSIQRVLLRPVKTDPGKNSFGVAAAHGKAALIQFPAVIGKIPDHGLNPLPPFYHVSSQLKSLFSAIAVQILSAELVKARSPYFPDLGLPFALYAPGTNESLARRRFLLYNGSTVFWKVEAWIGEKERPAGCWGRS